MCGITGFYGFEDKSLLKKMTETISHRGPDDSGYYSDKDVSLGHKRLSIIDLAGGKQPIHNENETVWVVYNGEIYNFMELRNDLIKCGHDFYTKADTEVIVHAYEEYGMGFVNYLRGMFAFALWDLDGKKLVLCRDRLGIKPLYYSFSDGILAFSSEIKSFLHMVKPEINAKALYRFLALRYNPENDTIIDGISKLMPGNVMVIQNGKANTREYWKLDTGRKGSGSGIGFWKDGVRRVLEESVKMRMISDVPLGAFLSGGVDSSIIVGTMSKFTDNLKTFSVGFDIDEYNELKYARIVSDRFSTDHKEITVNQDMFIKNLDRMAWHMDEPMGDATCIPTYFLSQLARKSVKVVLTGEGSDEIFAGYEKYKKQRMEKLSRIYMKMPGIGRKVLKYPVPQKYRNYAEAVETAGSFYLAPTVIQSDAIEKGISKTGLSNDIMSIMNQHVSGSMGLRDMLYLDIKTWLPEELLMKVDKMTMANSLEARVPYLDHKVIEFSMGIPDKFKIRRNVEKYILRESFRGMLSNTIMNRKKTGFSVPLSEWNRQLYGTFIDDVLKSGFIGKYLKGEYIKKLGSPNRAQDFFNVLMLHIWSEQFLGKI
jgi:asparagine synthase (glutamine-hydrolysing)